MISQIREFEITNDLLKSGVSRIAKEGDTIVVEYQDKLIRSGISKDFNKTIRVFGKSLDGVIANTQTKGFLKLCVSSNWLQVIGLDGKIENVNRSSESEKIDISYDEWLCKLIENYKNLQQIVKENLPNLWDSLEFELSVSKILNIKDCTLPFAGILLGRPSSLKTIGIELFRKWSKAFYTDNFSAKSFVSHSTSVKREELHQIDLMPKIKDKVFLTPELSPTFAKKDEDLIEILGIMTRVLDGHGYESDTGAHGHRGYNEDIMFIWIGAAVDIPHKVHRYLGTLGPKLYFLRLPKVKKSENDYLKEINKDDFASKLMKIQNVLIDYLKWFEICPKAVIEHGLAKVTWDHDRDDEASLKLIIKLAILLAHLRGVVPTWETKNTQGTDYAYAIATIEEPDRAMTQLRNLARGHALSCGRNYITIEDIPLVIKVVLSTASVERVRIFDLLIKNKGKLSTSDITRDLNTTNPTARRTMTELKALGLVEMSDIVDTNSEKEMTLKSEFQWFLNKEFTNIRDGFIPLDNSMFRDSKEVELKEQVLSIAQNRTPDQNELFDCYYCVFTTMDKNEYESHVITRHHGRLCYPNKASLNNMHIREKGNSWE
jgi:hypothetical protein